LPFFVTEPGNTDVLMVATAAFLALAVVAFGVLYFRLHSLPEHIAHKSQKVQMELVAVLGLISLFTHMHIFWIAGLILAFIDMPDFGTPLRRIAGSVEKIAGIEPPDESAEVPSESIALVEHHEHADATRGEARGVKQDDDAASAKKPAGVATTRKERSHV
jgi:hypothetical protein